VLFRQDILKRIETGEVTAAFRKWRRSTVKPGGTLKTSVGVLNIQSVKRVEPEAITDTQAVEAGYVNTKELREELSERREGAVYHVRFRWAGPDPRIALRQSAKLTADEWQEVTRKLKRLDRASRKGPWTEEVLSLLEANEGTRAGDLAPRVGQEKDAFKLNVRKLKNLGLTESLETGYRLSPRGVVVLGKLRGAE